MGVRVLNCYEGKHNFVIYVIKNIDTKRIFYVGYTKNLKERIKSHLSHKNRLVYKTIQKEQGEIVAIAIDYAETKKDAILYESFWTQFLQKLYSLVNLTIGNTIVKNEEKRIQSLKGRTLEDSVKTKIKKNLTKNFGKKIKCLELNKTFNSINEAARYMKVHHSSIRHCLSGRFKTSCGYHWEYIKK